MAWLVPGAARLPSPAAASRLYYIQARPNDSGPRDTVGGARTRTRGVDQSQASRGPRRPISARIQR